MPVGHGRDERPQPQSLGGLRQRRQHRPTFEARSGQVRGFGARPDRIEVVEQPTGLEQIDAVCLLPYREDL